MKKTFLLFWLVLAVFTASAFSQSWGTVEKSKSFFDSGNKTQVIVNKEEPAAPKTANGLSEFESTWNMDFEGLAYIMPDQPVPDQAVATFTGFGATYKFSDKMQIVSKWMQFDIAGTRDTIWHHDHKLVGFGLRDTFGNNQIWQVNLLTGTSTVIGNNDLGEVNNLEFPMFIDIKYMWLFGKNFSIGPQITFGRVPNSCVEPDGKYTDCGHGGYSAMSLTFQIGLPDDWGK